MTSSPFLRRASFASLVTAAAFASAGARAQGTDAQREACAPDAVNLCQDTIPDVPKTTACMKAHFAQLSPACKRAFNEAVGPSRRGRASSRVAGREDTAPPAAAVAPDTTVEVAPSPETLPGVSSYENQIRTACRQGLIDPFTCRNTLDVLKQSE